MGFQNIRKSWLAAAENVRRPLTIVVVRLGVVVVPDRSEQNEAARYTPPYIDAHWSPNVPLLCLHVPTARERRPLHTASGFSLPEALAVLAVLAITATLGAASLQALLSPLRRGSEHVEALFMQVRAKAMVTTHAHRIRPSSGGSLVVEYAPSCEAAAWTLDLQMKLQLPDAVAFEESGWSVCFSNRGIASENLFLTLVHHSYGQRRLEVLRGGSLRWLP